MICRDCNATVIGLAYCPRCTSNAVALDTRGHDKAAICRANRCGRYDASTDTCGVLTDRGKRGAIDWLYSNPDAKCVHPAEPQF